MAKKKIENETNFLDNQSNLADKEEEDSRLAAFSSFTGQPKLASANKKKLMKDQSFSEGYFSVYSDFSSFEDLYHGDKVLYVHLQNYSRNNCDYQFFISASYLVISRQSMTNNQVTIEAQ